MSTQRLSLPLDPPESAPPEPAPESPATWRQDSNPAVPLPDRQDRSPAATNASVSAEPLSWEQTEDLKNKIVAALCTCFDPEIPVNIYELGLIYDIEIGPSADVRVRMTLTSPACPAAGSLPPDVERKVRGIPGVTAAKVDVVWDPPWDKSRMSEAAKLQLGIDD